MKVVEIGTVSWDFDDNESEIFNNLKTTNTEKHETPSLKKMQSKLGMVFFDKEIERRKAFNEYASKLYNAYKDDFEFVNEEYIEMLKHYAIEV